MKIKLMAIVLGACLSVLGMASVSSAVVQQDGWFGCSANAVGPNSGKVFVQLTACTGPSGAEDVGWVVLSDTSTDQMLATFLTAMSLGRSVSVNIAGTWTDTSNFTYSQVVGLQMVQ